MVRLHALQSMAQHTASVNLDLALLCDDGALDAAARPEVVVHVAPGLLGVGSIVAGAVLATLEAGGGAGELCVDETGVVDGSLDGVRLAILGKLDGDAVGVERVALVVEAVVVDGVTGPEHGLLVVGVEELGVELGRHTEAGNVVVDDLQEANVAGVGHEVEGLRLDIGVVDDLPLEVLLGQLGVGRVAGVLADGLDGLGAVLGLLRAGNDGKTDSCQWVAVVGGGERQGGDSNSR